MTSPDQEFILNLRYLHNNSYLPLKKGNNLILSNFFPEFSIDNTILFNLNILSENEASLRTFDYFPLMINYTHNDSCFPNLNGGIQKEVLIKKQTIIYFNSLLNIQIFPLFSNHSSIQNKFFFFEIFHKVKENLLANNQSQESSKKIIFDQERKKDIKEKIVNDKNDDGNLNVKYGEIFSNNNLDDKNVKVNGNVPGKTEKINENEIIFQIKSNFFEKDDMKIDIDNSHFDLEQRKNSNQDVYSNNTQDNKFIIDSSEILKLNRIESEEQHQKEPLNILQQENQSKHNKISDIPKTNCDEVKMIHSMPISENISHSKISSSYQSSQSVNSSKENMSESIKNDDEQYNLLYRSLQESILPRKLLIIDDEEISKGDYKIISNSFDNTVMEKTLIPPRQTRSSSKSLNTSNIELLVKKRRRQKSHMNPNINKENSNSQNNLMNIIVVNKTSKSRDRNVNINETVNNVNKIYENENKDLIEITKSENFKENVKLILSSNSENVRQKCTICLDTIKNISRLDKCQHEFCKECIDQWAILSNECPLCKIEFKKIIYWESNSKQQEKKVKKRKFKYEEEDEEPWLRNCSENCMVCNKNNDEHLLLVCDRCSYNICHTYCAGLDIIPNDEWLCSTCINRRRARDNDRTPSLNQNNISGAESNIIFTKRRTVIVDDCDEVKSKKNNSIVSYSSNSIKNKNTKNINIPISYKLKKDEVNKNSLNLNLNLNLRITNSEGQQKAKKKKLVKKSLSAKGPYKTGNRYINQNERIRTRRRYNLRKKK